MRDIHFWPECYQIISRTNFIKTVQSLKLFLKTHCSRFSRFYDKTYPTIYTKSGFWIRVRYFPYKYPFYASKEKEDDGLIKRRTTTYTHTQSHAKSDPIILRWRLRLFISSIRISVQKKISRSYRHPKSSNPIIETIFLSLSSPNNILDFKSSFDQTDYSTITSPIVQFNSSKSHIIIFWYEWWRVFERRNLFFLLKIVITIFCHIKMVYWGRPQNKSFATSNEEPSLIRLVVVELAILRSSTT